MELPLRPPPLGVNSNFTNPDFLGVPVLITAGVGVSLVFLFAVIRVYARLVVRKKWSLDDYVFTLCSALAISIIAFLLSAVLNGLNGHHVWDVDRHAVSKASILSLIAFWIALGPILWLLKVAIFSFILTAFGHVRWLRYCAWMGIVITGLLFSTHTIVVTMTCGPRPNSDAQSYLNGLNRTECSSAGGANAIVGNITSVVNAISNIYCLLICYPMVSTLGLPRKELHGAYFMHGLGVLVCILSLMGAVYRVKSFQSADFTGNQIPCYAIFILETSLTLVTLSLPSTWVLYRHFTVPDINDSTTIGTPNMKLLSNRDSPQPDSRATWRKTHLNIEDIPYRRASSEYSCYPANESRMKALPSTPLPIFPNPRPSPDPAPMSPRSPMSPKSFKSMTLPIVFHPLNK